MVRQASATGTILKRKPLNDWKQKVVELLVAEGLVSNDFTGDLNLKFYQGGITKSQLVVDLK